jgi:hypothetical protein
MPARLVLAEAYRTLDRMDEARDQYAAALTLQTDNLPALFGMASLEGSRNRRDEALTWLEKAVAAAGPTAAPAEAKAVSQALFVALAERSRTAGNAQSCREAYRFASAARDAKVGGRELRRRARLCSEQ